MPQLLSDVAGGAGGSPDPNLGVNEHAVHEQAGRADDVSSLGEQRNMAISWKRGSEFERCQPNYFFFKKTTNNSYVAQNETETEVI